MRTAVGIGGAASGRDDWQEQVEFVREAERLGVDIVWSAEAWGQDALTPLAYLAAVTERIRLGTGIVQVSARAPSMTAMSAMTLSTLSDGRFVLGLGVSGPQVVEGLIGQPFARPLERLAEYVDGAGDEQLRALMEHHRDLCPECAEEHDILRRALGSRDG